MKISEYTLLEDAFEAAFPWMLNRLEDVGFCTDPHAKGKDLLEEASYRCFNEFMVALEELGVELGEVEAPLKIK